MQPTADIGDRPMLHFAWHPVDSRLCPSRSLVGVLESRIAKVNDKRTTATLTLPSPLTEGEGEGNKFVCLWRPLGTPPLFNCCWCLHPMRAGAADQRIRRPVPHLVPSHAPAPLPSVSLSVRPFPMRSPWPCLEAAPKRSCLRDGPSLPDSSGTKYSPDRGQLPHIEDGCRNAA